MNAVYRVLLVSFVNQIAVQGTRVLLALYALDFGASPFTVGILAALYSLFPMLLALRVGKLVDRIGARRPVMFGSVAAGLGLLIAYSFPGIPAILAAGLCLGMGMVIFNVCIQNLIGVLGTAETRMRDFSNFSLTNSTAAFIGPISAGLAIDHMGHHLACLYLAAVAFVPVLMLLFMPQDFNGGRSEKAAQTKGHFKELLAGAGMRRALAACSFQQAGDSMYQFYTPVYCHSIGLSATAIGLVLASAEAAAFIMRLQLPRLIARFNEERVLAFAFYMAAASMLLIPIFTSAPALCLITFCYGLGIGCAGPIVTMLTFSSAPPGRSAESIGLKVTVNHFVKVVSPIVSGSLGGIFGLAPVFWLNSLMFGAGGWLNQPRRRASIPGSSQARDVP